MENKISENIKRLRKEKGMTQTELAEKLHVTHQAISNWENGKTQPDVDTLTQIAQVFEVSVENLIYGEQKKRLHIAVKEGSNAGVTLGAALAMIISYTHWQSIGWAILHGIFGWFYVLYYIIKY